MPFTGAHPAAVLPFARTSLPLSALVIGSMVPDLGVFVPALRPTYTLTHSLLGVVTIDVLLTLVALAAWHGLVAGAVVAAAPSALRRRLPPGAPAGLRDLLGTPAAAARTAAAAALGALTHVVWDLFTHRGRWGVAMVPALQEAWGPLAGYRWAQYASGVLGVVVLATAVALWWRRTPPRRPEEARAGLPPARAAAAWAGLALAALVGAVVACLPLLGSGASTSGLAVGLAFGAVTGGGVGLVLAALALGVVHRVRGL